MNNISIIIITGLSGAGKSNAANVLEDLGYYTIDNMPLAIIDKIVELSSNFDTSTVKLAFVIDLRAKDVILMKQSIEMLQNKYNAIAIFMDASVDVLVKRYKETRRKHPLGDDIVESIKTEIELMKDVKGISDIILNTDDKNIHDLTKEISNIFSKDISDFIITIQSFGFKYGNPADADLMFDVRFLRNPHFDDGLRTMTGLSVEVKNYVREDEYYNIFFDKLLDMINTLIPFYQYEGKKYLNISIGCTGGKHRSVTVCEDLAGRLRDNNRFVKVKHRDINK